MVNVGDQGTCVQEPIPILLVEPSEAGPRTLRAKFRRHTRIHTDACGGRGALGSSDMVQQMASLPPVFPSPSLPPIPPHPRPCPSSLSLSLCKRVRGHSSEGQPASRREEHVEKEERGGCWRRTRRRREGAGSTAPPTWHQATVRQDMNSHSKQSSSETHRKQPPRPPSNPRANFNP